MNLKFKPSKEWLIDEYWNKFKSPQKIADELNISYYTVLKWLDRFKIKKKTRREAVGYTDFTNQKFGRLLVLKEIKGKPERILYRCECECGRIIVVLRENLKSGRTKSCGCLCREISKKINWHGYQEIGAAFWTKARRGAKKRQIEFRITIEEGWEIFLKQNRKCIFTQKELGFHKKDKYIASLDRIDSNLGYTKSNCQWVWRPLNRMKGSMTNLEFYNLCKLVSKKFQK